MHVHSRQISNARPGRVFHTSNTPLYLPANNAIAEWQKAERCQATKTFPIPPLGCAVITHHITAYSFTHSLTHLEALVKKICNATMKPTLSRKHKKFRTDATLHHHRSPNALSEVSLCCARWKYWTLRGGVLSVSDYLKKKRR